MGSACVNKKELFSALSQYVEELAVSSSQYFPENPDPQRETFGLLLLVFMRHKLLV